MIARIPVHIGIRRGRMLVARFPPLGDMMLRSRVLLVLVLLGWSDAARPTAGFQLPFAGQLARRFLISVLLPVQSPGTREPGLDTARRLALGLGQ